MMSGFLVNRPGLRQMSQTFPDPSRERILSRGADAAFAPAARSDAEPSNCLRVIPGITQNAYVSANCTLRPGLPEVIRPNCGLVSVFTGRLKTS